MSEIIDGVLSETLLDEIAEDLGITPGQLRENPVFRVLKGRVLLTYPLKTATFVSYYYNEELAHATTFYPPEGTIVFSALMEGAAAIAVQKFFWVDSGGAAARYPDAFLETIGETAGILIQRMVYCDGVNMGIRNFTGTTRVITLIGVSIPV